MELRGFTPFRCVPSSVRSVESAAVALRADVTAILAGSTMPALPHGGDPNALPSPRKRPTSSGPLRVLGSPLAVAHCSVPRRAPTQSRTLGMRECQAAWRFGVSVREYRELEAGKRAPTFETWDRICKLYGWPQTFVGSS